MKEYTEVADEAAEDKATIDAAQVKVDEEIAAEDAKENSDADVLETDARNGFDEEQPTLLDDAV